MDTRSTTCSDDGPLPALPEQPRHTDAWWLQASLELAEAGNHDCLESLGQVVRALADPPDPRAALAATLEAHTAALETKHALSGVRDFWGRVAERVAAHPVAFGGAAAVAVGLVATACLLWPTAVAADHSPRPGDETAEVRACKLIERGEYDAAWTILDAELDSPRGWHLRGEVEQLRGNEAAARRWYERAAAEGEKVSRLAIKGLDRRR